MLFKEQSFGLEFDVLGLARVLSEVGLHIFFAGKNVGHIAARQEVSVWVNYNR